MYVAVLVLGVFATAAGALLTAWGISIKEFSLGNTLLIAGTTAFIGGIVIIGVAGAIRELHRIAEALSGRQAMRAARPGEPLEAHAPAAMRTGAPGPRRLPAAAMQKMPPVPPYRPANGPAPEMRGSGLDLATPRPTPLAAAAGGAAPQPDLRAEPSQQAAAAEPPLVEESETFPLSPRSPQISGSQQANSGQDTHGDYADEDQAEPAREPSSESTAHFAASTEAVNRRATETDGKADAADPGQAEALEPAEEQGTLNGKASFDAIWPARPRFLRRGGNDSVKPEPPAPEKHNGVEPHLVPEPDLPTEAKTATEAASEPPIAAAESHDKAAAEAAEPLPAAEFAASPAAEPRRAVSILKSGVVDGMAYTLYSDGSIEADLAGETIRFTSIAELRQHIEASA